MKTVTSQPGRARGLLAATLVEMLTTMGLFTIAVAGLISVNLFGLKQDELVNSQLGASDQARLNFDIMLNEIRSGKDIQIGSGSYTNFTSTTNGLQQGDTIRILPATNNSVFIYYYFLTNAPTNSGWLMRAMVTNVLTTSNTVFSTTLLSTNIMAQYLTNMVVTNVGGVTTNILTNALLFSAVAYNGTNFAILTNDPTVYTTHNYLVNVLLQFYQYQYPLTKVGPNYLYSYYQLQLSAARRAE